MLCQCRMNADGYVKCKLCEAAPDLLKLGRALDVALHGYLQGSDPNKAAILSRAIDDHRAAIAKAEGR